MGVLVVIRLFCCELEWFTNSSQAMRSELRRMRCQPVVRGSVTTGLSYRNALDVAVAFGLCILCPCYSAGRSNRE